MGSAIAGAGGLWLASSPVLTSAAKRAERAALLGEGKFSSGVLAGPPGKRVTLWTCLDQVDRRGTVELEIARDPEFRRTVARERVAVEGASDFTAKARVGKGLRPGEEYFYRFATKHRASPVGRFRTRRPPDSREPVRIGFFSCQDWQAGYYVAHAGLAAEPDLDLVVCLGDYIYEQNFYAGPRSDTTGGTGDGHAQLLDDYRAKYRLYRTDPNLQAMHAAHPFVAIWDDHEVEDNWASDLPGHEDPPGGRLEPFAARRRHAFKAFFEHMPRYRLRSDRDRIYGALELGANAELFFLDTRQYRDDQPCDEQPVLCPEAREPGRTILGAEQRAWLERRVPASQAEWKVLANQVLMMSVEVAPAVQLLLDSWDGYAAERKAVLDRLLAAGTQNLTVFTGDGHTFWGGTVHADGKAPSPAVGTEFMIGSVTSPGLGLPNAVGANVSLVNPHIDFVDFEAKGYAVAEFRPGEALVELKAPTTIDSPDGQVETLARFRIPSGVPSIEPV